MTPAPATPPPMPRPLPAPIVRDLNRDQRVVLQAGVRSLSELLRGH